MSFVTMLYYTLIKQLLIAIVTVIMSLLQITTEGVRCSKVELAKILRERNEYKEKYLSLMDQVR